MDSIMIDTNFSYRNAEDENGVYASEKVSNHLLGLFSHYEVCDDKGKAYENQDDMMDDIEYGMNLFLHNFKNYRDVKGLAYNTIKNYKGILFDDYTINEDKTEWSQICNECYITHQEITERELDENSGHGICGILSCDNDSDHYIDFATQ